MCWLWSLQIALQVGLIIGVPENHYLQLVVNQWQPHLLCKLRPSSLTYILQFKACKTCMMYMNCLHKLFD